MGSFTDLLFSACNGLANMAEKESKDKLRYLNQVEKKISNPEQMERLQEYRERSMDAYEKSQDMKAKLRAYEEQKKQEEIMRRMNSDFRDE